MFVQDSREWVVKCSNFWACLLVRLMEKRYTLSEGEMHEGRLFAHIHQMIKITTDSSKNIKNACLLISIMSAEN